MRLNPIQGFKPTRLLAAVTLVAASASHAGSPLDSYRGLARGKESISTIGPEAFGERIDLGSGVTRFTVTDVSAATNSGIPMTVGRVLDLTATSLQGSSGDFWENVAGGIEPEKHVFSTYWELDVPYMRGVFDARKGWLSDLGDPIVGSPARCSNGFKPQNIQGVFPFHQSTFLAKDYWNGIQINIPGQGSEDLLNHIPGQQEPNDGHVWRGSTNSGARARCTSTIQNGSGEGFVVALPNGLRYTFDWMATRRAPSITSRGSWSVSNSGAWIGPPDPSANLIISNPPSVMVPRVEVFLYATRVEDQFGNVVSYHYDPANPFRLLTITSNDGQEVSLTYNSDGRISTITNGNRVWTYHYETIWYKQLSSITLPDSSTWQFSYGNLVLLNSRSERSDQLWSNCVLNLGSFVSSQAPHPDDTQTITMRHPSGLQGEYRFRRLAHGHNRVPGGCGSTSGTYFSVAPTVFLLPSLYQKTLTGPAIASSTWNFSYAPTYSFETACNPNCASTTSTTTVSGPESIVKVYTFGNDYQNNAGQLLQETVSDNNGLLRTTNYTYLNSASGQAFPDAEGIDPHLGNNPFKTKNRPLYRRVISQNGVSFTWEATTFNRWATPGAQFASNSLGFAQNRNENYQDDLDVWVLNQPASRTIGAINVESWDYDPITARPLQQRGPGGQVLANFTYHADGNLHQSTDGASKTTTFEDWYRGVPRLVRYADQTQVTATVNQYGWVDSFTDELNRVTSFAYDNVGRLNQITPPANPLGPPWAASSITFQPSATAQLGLPIGHWVQVITRGSWRQETRFNAHWQPVVTKESSTSGSNARFVVINYDQLARQTFRSYALDALNQIGDATSGITTSYDGLDRPKSIAQTSEDGLLQTTFEWLTGFKKRIRNPRLFQTTIEYQVFDQPDESWPTKIISPESQTTVILRDDVGKPTSISRQGLISGINTVVDRRFIYDNFERLCIRDDPERGEQVFEWDGANNLAWSAHGQQGLALRGIFDCPRQLVPQNERILRSYDNRHRMTAIDYPDQTADISYSWYADGAMKTASRDGSTWTYDWNSLGLIYRETLNYNGRSRQFQHNYNIQGYEASLVYPDGHQVAYSPNALGQAQQVGTYASNLVWHANGQLAAASFANGVALSRELNARRALSRTHYNRSGTPLVDLRVDYDLNGNIDVIDDQAQAGLNDQNFSYDGLDRIAGAVAPASYQSAVFEYDVFDNIRRSTLGNRDLRYQYNNKNQLSSLALPNGTPILSNQHNPRGSIVLSGPNVLTFDRADTLRQFNNDHYRYDAHGHRIETTAAGLTRYPVYTLDGLLRMEYGTDGDDRYIYLGSRLIAKTVNASTELFRDGFESTSLNAVTGSGPDTWYLTDHLGSSIATADAAGNILERSQFAPFGERWLKPPERGPGYAGHFEDGTNLTYMKARYYSAAGQFLSVDPVDVDTNHGTNFNRYWYANNSPTGFLDSDGKWGHRSDVPWYDFTGQVGNWFSELQDISADRAFGSNAAGPEALEQHAWKAGVWVVSVQTLALPEAGGTALVNSRIPILAPNIGRQVAQSSLRTATAKETSFKIIEQEGNIIVGTFQGKKGVARVIAEMVMEGKTLILRGTHIEGHGTLKEAMEAAVKYAKELGASKVIIEPGKRTTGARPGHIPRPMEREVL